MDFFGYKLENIHEFIDIVFCIIIRDIINFDGFGYIILECQLRELEGILNNDKFSV